jgi:hypothetical protein
MMGVTELCLEHPHPLMAAHAREARYASSHTEMMFWPVPGEGLATTASPSLQDLADARRLGAQALKFGLRAVFAASLHTNLNATAIIADDLLAAGCPVDTLPNRLAEVGGRMTDANSLTVAGALLRSGHVERAYAGLNRVMVEGHVQALGWRGVPLALLRQGEVVAAMTRAYLAAQVKRDPKSAVGHRMDKILHDARVSMSVRRGVFALERPPATRPSAGGWVGWLHRRLRAWRERAARA